MLPENPDGRHRVLSGSVDSVYVFTVNLKSKVKVKAKQWYALIESQEYLLSFSRRLLPKKNTDLSQEKVDKSQFILTSHQCPPYLFSYEQWF